MIEEFTREEKLKEVAREIALRRRVYPNRVLTKRLTQAAADRQIAINDMTLALFKLFCDEPIIYAAWHSRHFADRFSYVVIPMVTKSTLAGSLSRLQKTTEDTAMTPEGERLMKRLLAIPTNEPFSWEDRETIVDVLVTLMQRIYSGQEETFEIAERATMVPREDKHD